MRDVDFKTMLVIAFTLWPMVQSAFTWYPLQNYLSFGRWSFCWLIYGFCYFFQVENEENWGHGTKNAGDGELNSETGETQPQSAEKWGRAGSVWGEDIWN